MNEELAKRAVACKHWRWLAGMLCTWESAQGAKGQQVMPTSARVVDLPMGPLSLTFCLVDRSKVYANAIPDLDDPATLGCLLALVREAYGFRLWLASSRDGDMWYVDAASGALAHGETEAEALVAALEAAP